MTAALVLAGMLAALQPKPPVVDDAKVNEAIDRGVLSLRARAGKKNGGTERAHELILLALHHAGVRKGDALFDELLKGVLGEELGTTYRTALQAMLLAEVDADAHQKRIFQCAQFLVDNQADDGQWSYGWSTIYPEPEEAPLLDLASRRRFYVRVQRTGGGHSDNSNSQYALLGLRACHDSGMILPKEVLAKAARSLRDLQGESRGWSYGPATNHAYGSMTAGAIGSLTICDYLLEIDWKKDPALSAGLGWLRDNFTVVDNPRRPGPHHFYYLYALERAGMLYGTDKIGPFDWYREGAAYLIRAQLDDGSWNRKPVDTCFAILFLRKSTRPLVPSVDRK
jgi:hypothetical protein